jgi:hypothetical protein
VPGTSAGGASGVWSWNTSEPSAGGTYSFELRSVNDAGLVSSSGAQLLAQRLIASGWPALPMETICPDPYLLDPQWWQGIHGAWDDIGPGWFIEDNVGTGGSSPVVLGVRRCIVLWSGTFTGTGATFWESAPVPFSFAGAKVRYRAIGYNTSNRILRVGCNFYNPALNSGLGNAQLAWPAGGAAASSIMSQIVTVPAGTAWATFYVYMDAGAAFSGTAAASEIKLDFASDTGDLVPNSATETIEHALSDGSYGGTFATFIDENTYWSSVTDSIQVTPKYDCTAEASLVGSWYYANSTGVTRDSSSSGALINLDTESFNLPLPTTYYSYSEVRNVPPASSGVQLMNFPRVFALTGGVTYTFQLRLKRHNTPGENSTYAVLNGGRFKVVLRKR